MNCAQILQYFYVSQFLDDIIEEFDDKLYLNVPILGAHYQTDYSDESLSDEEDSAKSKKDHNKNRLGLSRYGLNTFPVHSN